jgi:carboxypeptidase C (cathepsin A)
VVHGVRAVSALALLLIALVLMPYGAGAAEKKHAIAPTSSNASAAHAPSPATNRLPARVETRHTLPLPGRSLDYRAIAETIELTTEKGDPAASIFTVSYLAERPAGTERPVAFVFNGGPGAASVYLHLGALGPRILETPPTGTVPPPPYRLTDNPSSWLAFTDLVLVDPVGTGFSRALGKGDNPGKAFWNVEADLDSLAAVVRRWLDRHRRWGAPIYLVGESYGGLRAAALAHTLEHDVGITVSGLVLISPALDVSMLHQPDIGNELASAFELPSFAATAAALSGTGSPAGAAEAAARFALSDYLIGLAGMVGVPPPDDKFIARIAQLIGLPEDIVRRARGRVSNDTFARELRSREHRVLSLYDGTVTRLGGADPAHDHAGDPVLVPATAAYTMAFERYLDDWLDYRTELPYRALDGKISQQWDWDAASRGERGLGLALTSLQKTMLLHPETRVLIANGRYDLVTPWLGSRWLIDQLALPEQVRAQIRLRVYEGGHMMYMRPPSRAALAADAAALFAGPPSAPPR